MVLSFSLPVTNISGKGRLGNDPQRRSEMKVLGKEYSGEERVEEHEILMWGWLM